MARAKPLGRRVPTDWKHVDRYSLAAVPRDDAVPTPRPVVIGINWYREFDRPKLVNQRYWVAKNGKLTNIRGGHCVCVPHRLSLDRESWWAFYNQGNEGACVGFGSSRCMSLLNQDRYYARWLWDLAKATDEWPETNPGDDEGTSVRAAMEILRTKGHIKWQTTFSKDTWQERDLRPANPKEGIQVYRWATSVAEVLEVLANPLYVKVGGIPFLNSWGHDYPRRVWIPLEVFDRLIKEDGEIAVVTDL